MRRTNLMRGLGLAPALTLTATLMLAFPGQAAAATLNVCPNGCPYSQVAPALAAARNGDTIRIGPGTYAGGLKIELSVKLLGAGAGRTIIKGGGPVITIGVYGASSEPTVLIDGVTMTGGVTHSSALSTDWVGQPNVIALGGGIEIVPNADFSGGAAVTISHSQITGNRAAPTDTMPFGPPCPDGPCPFAWAKGGGIDSWGPLTLVDTTVSDNAASGLASDANGGGINIWDTGSLELKHSRIIGNRAVASVPNGRFAEGGGVFTDPGVEVTISDSVVNGNTASLTSNLPFFVDGADPLDMNANGGGIHVGDGSTVTIDSTTFDSNRVAVSDPNGEPVAFSAALHPGDGRLVLRDSTITGNRTVADVGSTADVGPSGSAIDVAGQAMVVGTRVSDNTTAVTSRSGEAGGAGGGVYSFGAAQPVVISDSVISNNTTIASSTGGSAYVLGAGLVNDGRLVLNDDLITNNLGIVRAPTGSAQGGGIWNGSVFNQPPIELTLNGTSVTGNRLRGTPGITIQGGGLFTTFPVTLRHSKIAGNAPDDCFGCVASGSVAPRGSASLRTREWHSDRIEALRAGRGLRDVGPGR